MMGICTRCYTTNVGVTIVDGQTLCKACLVNKQEEDMS